MDLTTGNGMALPRLSRRGLKKVVLGVTWWKSVGVVLRKILRRAGEDELDRERNGVSMSRKRKLDEEL